MLSERAELAEVIDPPPWVTLSADAQSGTLAHRISSHGGHGITVGVMLWPSCFFSPLERSGQ